MDSSLLPSVAAALHTYLHDFADGAGLALHSAHNALFIILNPIRMLYLFAGVCMGLSRHSSGHRRHRRDRVAPALYL